MADPRFFPSSGSQRLTDIAAAAEARFEGDGERRFTGVAPLQAAGPEEVSFLDNRRYAQALAESKAGAVVLQPAMVGHLPRASPISASRASRRCSIPNPPRVPASTRPR